MVEDGSRHQSPWKLDLDCPRLVSGHYVNLNRNREVPNYWAFLKSRNLVDISAIAQKLGAQLWLEHIPFVEGIYFRVVLLYLHVGLW